MQKVFEIVVDIQKKILTPVFEVNTNDLKSVKLIITITNGQSLLDLTDKTVRISIRKPDDNIIFQDCEIIEAVNGKVEIILENQAYLMPGTHTAEVMCYKGEEVVAVTGTFSYRSIKGIMNDQAVQSKSEFTTITGMLKDVQDTINDFRENGTGIDVQARADIEKNTAALAGEATKLEDITKSKDINHITTKMVKKEAVTIVCYGDSITLGYIPGSGSKTANPYPETLQTILRDYYKNDLITVINEGYSGRQSDEFASNTYLGYVTRHNPDLVIFMSGINDNNGNSYGDVTGITDYIANIDKVRKGLNAPMILLTPTPTFGGVGTATVTDEDKKSRLFFYVKAMESYAFQTGLKLIDLNKAIQNYYYYRMSNIYEAAPDIVHYSDGFYKKIAEYIFTFGLANTDLIVKEEKFYPAIHPIFRFSPQTPRYFESAANPERWNILLINNQATNACYSYVFVDQPSVDFIAILATNINGSDINEIIVDGTVYSVSGHAKTTMWNVEKYITKLKYGLHKIELKAKSGTNGKFNLMVNALKFVPSNMDRGLNYQTFGNMDVAQSKKILWQGTEYIKSNTTTTGWMYKDVMTLSSQGNRHYRLFMEMTEHSGIGFGKYEVKHTNGSVLKAPIHVMYQGGSSALNFSLMEIPLSSDTAFIDSKGGAVTLKAGSIPKLTGKAYVILDLYISDTTIDYYVNGVLAVSVTHKETLIGDFNLWLWIYGDGTEKYTKLFKIEELPYNIPAPNFDIGDEYYDTVAKAKKIYDGTGWETVTTA